VGSEAVCSVSYQGRTSAGKALLETSEIVFRGDFRLRIPFSDIEALEARDGELRVGFGGGVAVFALGRQAERWAEKVRNPRGLLDKLGVKPGMTVAVFGLDDDDFAAQLRSGVDYVDSVEGLDEADIIFYEADTAAALPALSALRSRIKPAGAIWVVSPKGKGARLRDVEVMAAAREAGLVDSKTVSFSSTHTALKLVVPRALRAV